MAITKYSATIGRRLASKCELVESGCTEFTGYRMPSGYGMICRGSSGSGMELTHRVAWELANGPIPAGMSVCHSCDNPPCCNVEHLFLGTPKENTQDMLSKKREFRPAGMLQPNSKLTDDQVVTIRRLGEEGRSYASIGREFGITYQHASAIIRRLRWNTTEHTTKLGVN